MAGRVTAKAQGSDSFHLLTLEIFVDALDGNLNFTLAVNRLTPTTTASPDRRVADSRRRHSEFPAAPIHVRWRATFRPWCECGRGGRRTFFFDLVGKRFDEVGPGNGIDRLRDAGFRSKNLLRAQADARGLFRGQRKRFVRVPWCGGTACLQGQRSTPGSQCAQCCSPAVAR